MEVTDRHHRALTRLITRHATLYTEMVVDRTLIHNPILRERELRIPWKPTQQPIVLQLGGSDPDELESAARIAAKYPYNEVNLNCGCPSPKVAGKGCFGAALMRTPDVVAEATRRMRAVLPSHVPVTVKCRIGVDDEASYESLSNFVRVVSEKGLVRHFIIHARKAILGGLSPAQNRTIPPLRYDFVYALLEDFPHLLFSINGGVKTIDNVRHHLSRGVHGAMVGRAVMDRPWQALADVDVLLYNAPPDYSRTRRRVLEEYAQYAENEITESGCSVRAVVRPVLNLFAGEKNGKRFRREIDTCLREKISVSELLKRASAMLPDEVLDALPLSAKAALEEKRDMNVQMGESGVGVIHGPDAVSREAGCAFMLESNELTAKTAVSET